MNHLTKNLLALTLLLFASSSLLACGETENENQDEHGADVHELVLTDRSSGDELAETHNDHWDGGPLTVEIGEELSVNAIFLDHDDDVIDLAGTHYAVGFRFADGADEIVASISAHGDHLDIEGEAEGMTRIIIQLLHDGEVDWESPALTINVVEHDDHNQNNHGPHVHELVLTDRGSGAQLAEFHVDHWDGAPLTLELGGALEVNTLFYGEDDALIALDGTHYSVGYRYAAGAGETIIDVHTHGDHLDIDAESVGTTSIIIQLLHDGAVEWEAPALAVEVVSTT